MTQLAACILYTRDVMARVGFYEKAFGMERKFVAPQDMYVEMAGAVPLAFCSEDFIRTSGIEFQPASSGARAQAFEVVLVFEDVGAAYQRAVAAGATAVQEPKVKPWGQTVAYVRDPDGVLVELCTAWSNG